MRDNLLTLSRQYLEGKNQPYAINACILLQNNIP